MRTRLYPPHDNRPPDLQPSPPRRKRRRSLLLSFLGFCFAAAVVIFFAASAGVGYTLWKASKDLPDYESLAKYEPPVMTRIHAHNGALIAEYARERRIFVPINTVPKRVIGAFLSAEDRRFYEHGGLDFQGIGRALYKLVEAKIEGKSRRAEGASTITQQVAKNFLLTNERSIDRKIKEAILAVRIERAFPKDKILELYLNEIYLGIGAYGVAAASMSYFNKELQDLTVEEAAYLAALPKAPNNYHPFRQPKAAIARRNWIIGQMAENGYITSAEAEAAKKKPLGINLRATGAHIFAAEYFAEEVRRTLLTAYGEDKLYSGGLSVRTTLDPHLQQLARGALVQGLVDFDRRKGWRGPVKKIDISGDWGPVLMAVDTPPDIQPWRLGVVLKVEPTKATVGLNPEKQQDGTLVDNREAVEINFEEVKWARTEKGAPKTVADVLSPGDVIYVAPKDPANVGGVWSLMQFPEVGGALVALDPNTGRVLADVGGFSFAMSQFDRAIQARRQPGSAFKPFVYAAAIDNGYKPTSIILDAPIEIEQGPNKDIWRPENYEKEHSAGPSTLRFGIEHSRNQMTVRLAQDLGMPIIIDYAKRFGIYDDLLPVLADVARRRRDDAFAARDRLLHVRQRRARGARDLDRPHPGPLGPHRVAARSARMRRLQGGVLGQPGRARDRRRPQADHRPAHGLPDHVDPRGRDPARHGDRSQVARPAARRQDRHHQRREGRLVHRLFARPRRRRLHRLRHAEAHGQGADRRPGRRARVRRLHEAGARRYPARAVPDPARHQARARQPAHGAARLRR